MHVMRAVWGLVSRLRRVGAVFARRRDGSVVSHRRSGRSGARVAPAAHGERRGARRRRRAAARGAPRRRPCVVRHRRRQARDGQHVNGAVAPRVSREPAPRGRRRRRSATARVARRRLPGVHAADPAPAKVAVAQGAVRLPCTSVGPTRGLALDAEHAPPLLAHRRQYACRRHVSPQGLETWPFPCAAERHAIESLRW